MQTTERIAKLETQKGKLVQEIGDLQAKQRKLQSEKEAHVFAAYVELSGNAQKQVDGLNSEIGNLGIEIADRQMALDSLERKLAEYNELLRQEKLAQAGRACLETLLSAYQLRAEIEGMMARADEKWKEIESLQSVASKHRAAAIEFGGKREDYPIPLTFREPQEGQTVLMIRNLEQRLGK